VGSLLLKLDKVYFSKNNVEKKLKIFLLYDVSN